MARCRRGPTMCRRWLMTRRTWAYRVDGEKSERVPSGGSSTMTAPTCMGVVAVSSDRNAASIPSSGSIRAPSCSGVAEATAPPAGPAQSLVRHLGEAGLLDRHDHQLGDPVAAGHRVVVGRIVVDQDHLQFP